MASCLTALTSCRLNSIQVTLNPKCRTQAPENTEDGRARLQLASRQTQAMAVALQPSASGEARMGRPIRNAAAVMAHTAFTGVPVHAFTADHTRCSGTAPSLENAQNALHPLMYPSPNNQSSSAITAFAILSISHQLHSQHLPCMCSQSPQLRLEQQLVPERCGLYCNEAQRCYSSLTCRTSVPWLSCNSSHATSQYGFRWHACLHVSGAQPATSVSKHRNTVF